MKTRKMAMVWIGVLLLAIVPARTPPKSRSTSGEADPWGASGGSVWARGAVDQRTEEGQVFYTAAAREAGGKRPADDRRRVRHHLGPYQHHAGGHDGDGHVRRPEALQGHAGHGLHGRPGGLRGRWPIADQEFQRPGGKEGERRRPGRDRAFDRQEHVQASAPRIR